MHRPSSITASYAGALGASFVTDGIDPSPWLVRAGLALTGKSSGGVEMVARYDVEYRENFLNQTASVTARWLF